MLEMESIGNILRASLVVDDHMAFWCDAEETWQKPSGALVFASRAE